MRVSNKVPFVFSRMAQNKYRRSSLFLYLLFIMMNHYLLTPIRSRSESSFIRHHHHHHRHYRKSPFSRFGSDRKEVVSSSSSSHSTTTSSSLLKENNNNNMSPILNSPSAQRNKDPIWNVLKEYCLPTKTNESIHILEVAAGTGVHTMYFASQFAHSLSSFNNNIHWYPTDPDETARASITGRIQKKDEEITTETNNVIIHTPICMTLNENGPMEKMIIKEDMDLMICINMIHVAPWEATIGLMKLASQKLSSNGGKLCMYGPYKIKGKTADSNL